MSDGDRADRSLQDGSSPKRADPDGEAKRPSAGPSETGSGDLGARIDAARAKLEQRSDRSIADKYNTLTLAWRMTIELVVGAAIGFGIGWGLDQLFGTLPLFLIVFGLLGFVAGVKTVIATADEVGRRKTGGAAEGSDRGD